MKIAVCDDDAAFCNIFCRVLEERFALRDWDWDCQVFSSGQSILKADLAGVQVVFMDVDMPGIDGMEAARQLRTRYHDLLIVFVTAFPKYAVEGYCVDALRYLLKESLSEQLPECLDAIEDRLTAGQGCIKVHTPDQALTVRLEDILYCEGTTHRRTLLHTSSGATIECMGRLGEHEKELAGQDFLRIQKSYLVNMRHVEDIRNYTAVLTNGEALRVSRQGYSEICRRFVLWKGLQL